MKKKFVGRLGVVALALTLISTCLMGGTLAKYTADVAGSATATVAKFAFDLNGATEQSDKATIGLDALFSNSYGTNEEVKADTAKKVVAPGTSGKVAVTLTNNGEVAIQPAFTITETNTGSIPLQYAITTTETAPAADATNTWKTAGDKGALDLNPTQTAVGVGKSAQTYYLHWRWNPSSVNTADTALGTAADLAKATLEIKCTVSQVLPTAPTA